MKKSLGFPVLSFLGCGGLSHVSLLSLAWNASGPRVSSRQFGQLTLLCQLSEQVDVMVMVFGHNCGHDLGQGQGHGHGHRHGYGHCRGHCLGNGCGKVVDRFLVK